MKLQESWLQANDTWIKSVNHKLNADLNWITSEKSDLNFPNDEGYVMHCCMSVPNEWYYMNKYDINIYMWINSVCIYSIYMFSIFIFHFYIFNIIVNAVEVATQQFSFR